MLCRARVGPVPTCNDIDNLLRDMKDGSDTKAGTSRNTRGFRGCWFVSADGVAVDAMTGGQIIDALKRGDLSLDAHVIREGMPAWAPISAVPALANSTLLFRDGRIEATRSPRPVLLDALPNPGAPHEHASSKPRRMTGLAYRARDYLAAFFAASFVSGLFRL